MRGQRTSPALAALVLAAACQTSTEFSSDDSVLLAGFASAPLGMSNLTTTFDAAGSSDSAPWMPRGRLGGGRPGGPHGFLMGGLGGPFLGLGLGAGFGHRPSGEDCEFNSETGRVECDPVTRGWLTIVRSVLFLDVNGNGQSAFDSLTTNAINTRIQVTGTLTRRDGATSEVEHESDRTVSGLAPGSTQRTVNGTSRGEEQTTGSNETGDFTLERVAGDTILNLVFAAGEDAPPYPIAGTIIRAMQVVLTYTGEDPVSRIRREVITYDGSDTATIVITHNGETKTCRLPLPRGRPSCS